MATIFDAPGYLTAKTNLYNSNFDPNLSEEEIREAINDIGLTLQEHYQQFGQQELADAGIDFDAQVPFNEQAYLEVKTELYQSNFDPDATQAEVKQLINEAGYTLIEHYETFGKEELNEANIPFPTYDTGGGNGGNNAGQGGGGNGADQTIELGAPSAPTSLADLIKDDVSDVNLNAQGLGQDNKAGLEDTIVSAEDASGLDSITSYYSTSDLTVLEVQEVPSDFTIGMDHTTGDDSLYDAANMTVKFDQDYLTTSVEQKGYFFRVLNRHLEDLNGQYDEMAAEDAPVGGLENFTINVNMGNSTYTISLSQSTLNEVKTIENLVNKLNQEVADDSDIPDAIQFGIGADWTDSVVDSTQPQVTVTSTGNQPVTSGGNISASVVDQDGDITFAQGSRDAVPVPVATDVTLKKVGQSTDGGGLIIGSMQATGNVLGSVSTVNDTVPGIQTFNVTVEGDQSLSSSLAYLQSTANTLQTVNIESDNGGGDSFADLYIGNSNTLDASNIGPDADIEAGNATFGNVQGNAQALKDVATLDASAFQGDLHVYAGLTDEFDNKYGVHNPATGGQEVNYTGGSGNDTIRLAISEEVAEDSQVGGDNLNLIVNGGEGNDVIDIDGGVNSLAESADPGDDGDSENNGVWTLSGGAGNDTFNLSGVDGGEGDNDGNSTIVFNQDVGLGNETIIDFSGVDGTAAAETQELQLAQVALSDGESVTLNIAGQTVTYQYDADATNNADADGDGEVGGSELADALADAVNNASNLPFSAPANGDSTLTITADNNGNIGPITAEIPGDVLAFQTTPPGGATDEQIDGNDVLDFSSYNLDELVVTNEGDWNNADSDLTGSGNIFNGDGGNLNSTDAFIALINQEITSTGTGKYEAVLYADQDTNTTDQTTLGTLKFEDEGGTPVMNAIDDATAANFIINDADAGMMA